MSIVTLTKVTLFGSIPEQNGVLAELQNLGCMHLIVDRKESPQVEFTPPTVAESDREALEHLRLAPHRRRQILDEKEFNFEQVVAAALQNKQQHRSAVDRRISLVNQIEETTPWGHFALPSAEELDGYRLWFYRVPFRERKKLDALTGTWIIISEDHRYIYVVLISKEEPPSDLFSVPRTTIGEAPLNELKERLYRVDLEIEEIEAEHTALSRWISFLSGYVAEVEDQAKLEIAVQDTRQVENFFVVQGWIPLARVPDLRSMAQNRGLAFLQEDPGLKDSPPTLLKNPPALEAGQDLVSFYTTPGYHSWDPSALTAISFAIFFGMIMADAGYALILAIPLVWFYPKLGRSAGGRRLRSLATMILAAAFLYGALSGSYFGTHPVPGSLLNSFRVLPSHDLTSMMLFSLGIGCLHLIIANALQSRHASTLSGKIKPLGWILLIVAGVLLFGGRGDDVALWNAGIMFLVAGAVVLVVFGSSRPITSVKAGLLRILDGVSSLFNITKLFGDILSYLRLFALGLASASLAFTFNDLAGKVRGSAPGFGVLFAVLILLFGHTLNLTLGIISGVVHGLRLNYIEFFGWSISEEGRPFNAFSKKETQR